MVRAWIADIRPLCEDKCYRKYYEELPDFRKRKADALKSVQGKAQSVGVWSLLEKIRAEEGLPESSAYNLSHSGDYVLCAFSQREIGADIQQERDCPVERLAERFFSQEERRRFAGYASEREKKNYFYECWCRREAYGKLTGEGVGKNLGSCIDDKAHWIMLPSPEGYRAAACMRLCEKEK